MQETPWNIYNCAQFTLFRQVNFDGVRILLYPRFKRKVLLRKITKANYDERGKYFRYGWINMELLHEQLQEHIVQANACKHQQEVPRELNPSPQVALREYHITTEIKTHGKRDAKRRQKRSYVRADSKRCHVHHLLFKNEVVADKKDEDIQRGIEASTCCIPKCLQWHKPAKQGVENIYKAEYELSHQGYILLKWAAKISLLKCTFAHPNR